MPSNFVPIFSHMMLTHVINGILIADIESALWPKATPKCSLASLAPPIQTQSPMRTPPVSNKTVDDLVGELSIPTAGPPLHALWAVQKGCNQSGNSHNLNLLASTPSSQCPATITGIGRRRKHPDSSGPTSPGSSRLLKHLTPPKPIPFAGQAPPKPCPTGIPTLPTATLWTPSQHTPALASEPSAPMLQCRDIDAGSTARWAHGHSTCQDSHLPRLRLPSSLTSRKHHTSGLNSLQSTQRNVGNPTFQQPLQIPPSPPRSTLSAILASTASGVTSMMTSPVSQKALATLIAESPTATSCRASTHDTCTNQDVKEEGTSSLQCMDNQAAPPQSPVTSSETLGANRAGFVFSAEASPGHSPTSGASESAANELSGLAVYEESPPAKPEAIERVEDLSAQQVQRALSPKAPPYPRPPEFCPPPQRSASIIASPDRPQIATVIEVTPAKPLSLQYSIGVRGSSLSSSLPVVDAAGLPPSSQSSAPTDATSGHHSIPNEKRAVLSCTGSAAMSAVDDAGNTISASRGCTPTEHWLRHVPEVTSSAVCEPGSDIRNSQPRLNAITTKDAVNFGCVTCQQVPYLAGKRADISNHAVATYDSLSPSPNVTSQIAVINSHEEVVSGTLSASVYGAGNAAGALSGMDFTNTSAKPYSWCHDNGQDLGLEEHAKATDIAPTASKISGNAPGRTTSMPVSKEARATITPTVVPFGIVGDSRLQQAAHKRQDVHGSISNDGVEQHDLAALTLASTGGADGTPLILLHEDTDGNLQPSPMMTPQEARVAITSAADSTNAECRSGSGHTVKAPVKLPGVSFDQGEMAGVSSGRLSARDSCAELCSGEELTPIARSVQKVVPAMSAEQNNPFSIRWEIQRTPAAPVPELSAADARPAATGPAAAATVSQLPGNLPSVQASVSPIASVVKAPRGFGLHAQDQPHVLLAQQSKGGDIDIASDPEATLSPLLCVRDPFAKVNKLRYSDQCSPRLGTAPDIDLRPDAGQQATSPTLTWPSQQCHLIETPSQLPLALHASSADKVTDLSSSMTHPVADHACEAPPGQQHPFACEASCDQQHTMVLDPSPVLQPDMVNKAAESTITLPDLTGVPEDAPIPKDAAEASVVTSGHNNSLSNGLNHPQLPGASSSLSSALKKAAEHPGIPQISPLLPQDDTAAPEGSSFPKSPMAQLSPPPVQHRPHEPESLDLANAVYRPLSSPENVAAYPGGTLKQSLLAHERRRNGPDDVGVCDAFLDALKGTADVAAFHVHPALEDAAVAQPTGLFEPSPMAQQLSSSSSVGHTSPQVHHSPQTDLLGVPHASLQGPELQGSNLSVTVQSEPGAQSSGPSHVKLADLKVAPSSLADLAEPATQSLNISIAAPTVTTAQCGSSMHANATDPRIRRLLSPALTCIHASSPPPARMPRSRMSAHGSISILPVSNLNSSWSTTAAAEPFGSKAPAGPHDTQCPTEDAGSEGAQLSELACGSERTVCSPKESARAEASASDASRDTAAAPVTDSLCPPAPHECCHCDLLEVMNATVSSTAAAPTLQGGQIPAASMAKPGNSVQILSHALASTAVGHTCHAFQAPPIGEGGSYVAAAPTLPCQQTCSAGMEASLLNRRQPVQLDNFCNATANNGSHLRLGAMAMDTAIPSAHPRRTLRPIKTIPLVPCTTASSTPSQDTPFRRISSSGTQMSPYLITVRKTPTSPPLRAPVFPALQGSPSAPAAYFQVPNPNSSAGLNRILSMPSSPQVRPALRGCPCCTSLLQCRTM
jgi:hypothetical protein